MQARTADQVVDVTHRQPDARKQIEADSVDAVERGHDISCAVVTAREQVMNAPPNIDPVTAHSDSDVMHWLTNDTRDKRFIDNIFAELFVRLQRLFLDTSRCI
jgi:hypothetical protein